MCLCVCCTCIWTAELDSYSRKSSVLVQFNQKSPKQHFHSTEFSDWKARCYQSCLQMNIWLKQLSSWGLAAQWFIRYFADTQGWFQLSVPVFWERCVVDESATITSNYLCICTNDWAAAIFIFNKVTAVAAIFNVAESSHRGSSVHGIQPVPRGSLSCKFRCMFSVFVTGVSTLSEDY